VHADKMRVAWSDDGTRLLTSSSGVSACICTAAPDLDRVEEQARGRLFHTLSRSDRGASAGVRRKPVEGVALRSKRHDPRAIAPPRP
jgi:hypothetical protein